MEQTGGVFIGTNHPAPRPAFDPMIRPSTQVDVMDEIRRVTRLDTAPCHHFDLKRIAEDLTEYLHEKRTVNCYMYSDIDND
jgi:excinuclease UvrABC helicase subunit UvrB